MKPETAPGSPQRTLGHSNDDVRGFNRRLVLNLIRTRQPLSRADLARISGLQRSTISLIVEELIAERWVVDGPTARLPRGRHPTSLRLNGDRVIIGVDIRPTHMTLAIADVNGNFSSHEAFPTPRDPEQAIRDLVERLRRMLQSCKGKMVEGIGVTLPGRFDTDSNRLVFAPNLKWPECDLRTPITKATGHEVVLENAANASVLSAVWFGKNPVRNLVGVTVSEGIGTGLFINGQLARGNRGMAGEFGHVPLDPQGPECTCGSRGCWEVFGSNRAALRYYFESRKCPPDQTSFIDLLGLAEEGDPHAAHALDRMAFELGRGMRMIVAGLAPSRITVIGELTRSWRRFGPVIEREVRDQVLPGGSPPAVIPVHEDGMARLRGTIALVLQKDFGEASTLDD